MAVRITGGWEVELREPLPCSAAASALCSEMCLVVLLQIHLMCEDT